MIERIFIEDVQAANMCVTGAKRWFASKGLDFKSFLDEGIPVETLRDTADALALKVIERAEMRRG